MVAVFKIVNRKRGIPLETGTVTGLNTQPRVSAWSWPQGRLQPPLHYQLSIINCQLSIVPHFLHFLFKRFLKLLVVVIDL